MITEEQGIQIIKANGEPDIFSANKLRESLVRSGASSETAELVVAEVLKTLHEGMTTNQIYRTAFRLLKRLSKRTAPRYSLKRAIMDMGPSGYPFEHLVAGIFRRNGFQTQVGQIRPGRCVNHEVDVLAHKPGVGVAVECKYHNRQGYVCDVKVPLYIQSRFLDLQAGSRNNGNGPELTEGWVVTNTRFSGDAIVFGSCVGLKLVSWDYPENGGLKELIERAGLYPVTVLTSLSKAEKTGLLNKGIVLCSELFAHRELLAQLHVPEKKIDEVLAEAGDLCGRVG